MAQPMILIHGTWGSHRDWDNIREDFAAMGFKVMAPDLLFHDLPSGEVAQYVGDVSLLEYTYQILRLVRRCEERPIIVGHSLGGLIAQLVAERVAVKGLILLGPAPTADIHSFYPSMLESFLPHFFQWGFWKKPIMPSEVALTYAYNQHEAGRAEQELEMTVPDSGKAYTQMGLPILDRRRTSQVDFTKIQCPVLVITGMYDKLVVPQIAEQTARNYGNQATLLMHGESDHMYITERFKDTTAHMIHMWLEQEGLLS
ncbi:alpha/beta hydrolase [Suicoccus acidiformans]|uniref:Alpha/beta hydrolase n=1 Tax=Suicoccus acidiformans TaxID=2036206 RepID=A0A347WMK6_9LACT|nr:alpha/beta hydrolase [Suicoccus acidiformans]AXY26313.1 alpha/beta hydrolase [Suicoccus acidiformans]